jgi:quercetin dioxygenase-like cupin family protein
MTALADGTLVVSGDTVERLDFPTQVMHLLADKSMTAGAFSVVRGTLNPGADGARPHTHKGSSELFYVLDGAVDILVDDDVISATKGDLAIVAPNTMHAFAATPEQPAELLILFNPAIERFDYFRLLKDVVEGKRPIADLLASQERFDNWFSDSAAWTAHRSRHQHAAGGS